MESGIPEVITNGENGLIVCNGDYDAWAAQLVDLWSDPERLATMSQQARDTVRERFTVEQVGQQFDALFRQVAAEICGDEYRRPRSLNWGASRSPTGDVLPPPNLYRPPVHTAPGSR